MTATAWAHLPNAEHIDRVLASLKAHPDKWEAAQTGTQTATYIEAWNAMSAASRTAAYIEARNAAYIEARNAAYIEARNAARGAIAALIAWDDCAYMLELPEDALKLLRAVGNEQALLLLGAAKILKETS